MKFLVCISKVPDTTSKITFTDNNTKFNDAGVQYIVNPYDEWYALVRALELKETLGGNVTIISVGGAEDESIIRKALAIGADDAVRIDAKSDDPLFIAKQIAEYAKDKAFDVIFCGKETINYNSSQVPGALAELLDLPFLSLVTKLDFNGSVATIECDIQGGSEVVEVSPPFVISASKGLAEQRIPNMRGIMAAKTKALTVIPAVNIETQTTIVQYELPNTKTECKMVSSDHLDDLIQLLHNEAKVI